MKTSHLPITRAGLVSALTFIVGQLVAFVPSIGPDKQNLISAGTTVIAAVFLVANAIHHLADSKTPTALLPASIPVGSISVSVAPVPPEVPPTA